MNFVTYPEAILITFLKEFFSQESLYTNLINEFIYTDNQQHDSLIVKMTESYADETINAMPAIIIQELGFQEQIQSTGNNVSDWSYNRETKITPIFHQYAIHCVAETKAACKLLQGTVAMAIISFRKALYEAGLDHIPAINGSPPINMGRPDQDKPGPYDGTISVSIKTDINWILYRSGFVEEKVRVAIRAFVEKLEDLEYDSNGELIIPETGIIEQKITINNNT